MNNPTIFVTILASLVAISEVWLSMFKRAKSDTSTDQRSLRLIWRTIGISMVLGGFVAYLIPQAGFATKTTVYLIGPTIVMVGLILRWYAILWLGKYFTVNVAIADDHKVIDTGPYRYMRHPSYTGTLLEFLGLAICFGNWLTMVVILAPITWVFWRRISIEESALESALGKDYSDYMARTKRLIPFIF